MHYFIMKIPNNRELKQIASHISSDIDFDVNREAAKISALSSGKIDKYEYLTGEEILPPERVIKEQW